jgi:GTPase SAR1 family protein
MTTFIPFLRRFTDEKAVELADVRALYQAVRAKEDTLTEDALTVGKRVYPHYNQLPDQISTVFSCVMYDLLKEEPYLTALPRPAFDRMSLKEFVEYRNLLLAKQYFFANERAVLARLDQGLINVLGGIARILPAIEDPSPFTIPLAYALPDPKDTITRLFITLAQDQYRDAGLFRLVFNQLYTNVCAVSGRDPFDDESKRPLKLAKESTLTLDKLVDAYLADTPFHELFMTPVPLKLTHQERFNHTHIVGGTNAGKTTLIENLILHDLSTEDPPSVVLIDPHGDLIQKLIHLDAGIEDRLLYIDPRDIHHPVGINVFAMNHARMAAYDEVTREQVSAGVIQTFDYLFSSLFDLDLTGKQQVFFRYVTRLMLSLPETLGRNATILDMLALVKDATPYQEAIERLPPIQRDFFKHDFAEKTFAQTKEQIRYRLQSIIENPTLARLFTSPDTKLDFFTALNSGNVILIDTAADFLKDASATFGRILISLILQAIQERAAIPPGLRKPTFIYIDEAANYFSDNIDSLLTDARKYKAGMLLSHQYLEQASSKLRASLAANTSIKFAASLSAGDARTMATEMRTTPDFITDQPRLHFAAHIRNVTPNAVSIPIGFVNWEPKLSDEAFAAFIERNRHKVSLQPRHVPKPEPTVSTEPDEDISTEW